MTLRELKKLVLDGEGGTVEFKETTGQRSDACRTLCAFLNGNGGTVVFGVSRKGILQGQTVSDTTKRDLFEVFDRFEPAADIATEWIRVDKSRQAIVCRVERGNMQFCFKHLNLAGKVEGFLREERLELPPEALREAILNALAHRQYSRTASVSLAIYDDRVEITSPGGLPPGKTVGALMEEHESEPRNTLVAQVMYLRKTIEMWGRGFSLMATECARYAVPAPLVAETPDGFVKVAFQRPTSAAPVVPEVGLTDGKAGTTAVEVGPTGKKIGPTPPEVGPTGEKVDPTSHETDQLLVLIKRTLDACSPVLRKDTRRNAETILLEIARDPAVTIMEIVEKASISRTTVKNIQALLKNFGILYRIGGHFGGRWLVVWKGTPKTS